jgi:rod shape-determining protein MreC
MRSKFFYLIIILLLALLASFFWLKSKGLANTSFSFLGQLNKPFYSFFKNIGLFVSHIFSAQKIYERNLFLETELEEKEAQILALKEAITANALKEEFSSSAGVLAKVLMADPEGSSGQLILGGGEDKGLKEGANIVIHNRVLVGRLTKVYPSFSKAETLLSPNLKIGGQDSRSGVLGLVESTPEGLYFKLLPATADVKPGDIIVTSLENKQFMKGLIIGEVVEIQDSGLGTKSAKIKTAFDWPRLDQVMVLNIFSD